MDKEQTGGARVAFFVNSALAFAFSELLTAALHEAGHGAAAQLLGFSPRIYAFFEDNPTGNVHQTLVILAAGPVASLVLGLAFLSWYRRGPARYSYPRLLLFWLAWLGIMEFVNYLIVTPWLGAGDTAQIAGLLGWHVSIRYVVAVVGVAILFTLARPAAAAMMAIAPQSLPLDTPAQRRRFVMGGFYLPLLAGIALTALAGIGGRPLMVGFGLLATLGNIDIVVVALYSVNVVGRGMRAPDAPLRIEPAGILLYLAIVALYVFVLSHGLPV